MAAITIAGENLIAEKQAAQEVLVVSKFLYALVPGLDPATPVDRYAGKPPPDQMMYETDITKGGYVDPNQVVYSSMIGSNVGDWDFNWLGLETAEGVLLAAAYTPVQQKRKNIPNQQIGNNITRNMMLVFDGAQSVTELTINADTWQADFTVRMAGMDERERLSNRDMFGRACFFANSLALVYQSEQFTIQPGTAYVEGLAVHQPIGASITPPAFPFTLWYDISLQGQLSEVNVVLAASYGDALVDFTDTNGVWHYLVPVATVLSATEITDLRSTVEPIAGALIQHLAARSGDYSNLRARATTKDDVGLGNLPNEKSDDPESNSSDILATTALVHAVKTGIETDLGSAAYLDAQIDLHDATPDALMKVGAFGWGGAAYAVSDVDIGGLNAVTALYFVSNGTGGPGGAPYEGWVRVSAITPGQYAFQEIYGNADHTLHRRALTAGVWGEWESTWDSTDLVKQIYPQDDTPGRVLLTGAYGIGHGGIVLPDGTDLNTVTTVGIYRVNPGPNVPEGGQFSPMLVTVSQDTLWQQIIGYNTGTTYSRGGVQTPEGYVFSAWVTGWDTSNFDPASIFAVPVGVPFPWPTATPPDKCVLMGGQPFNVEWYPALAAVYPSGFLPDMRAESIRGLDGGRGIDPDSGRPVLSLQLDTLQNMTGEFVLQDDDSTLLVNNATGVFSVGTSITAITPAAPQVTTTGYRSVVFNPSAVVRVSTETRMRNVAYNYICRMY
ncbi:Phage tail collar family protein [Pseudomonas sp. IT-196MI5]|uniref:phage tail-collar fiber domain-containing protein n=1 Tax=Pseudomonas sp. IT-196MI5 TaxID=3026440 RepID=UPI0039E12E5C